MTSLRAVGAALLLTLAVSGCEDPFFGGGGAGGGGGSIEQDPANQDLGGVEDELLDEINQERMDAGLPALERDPGLDAVMRSHGIFMAEMLDLTHIDDRGFGGEERARYYSGDDSVRCSEIIQWWGGAPDGGVHYDGYFNSPPHHSAYMEEGIFNLGPTQHAGVVVIAATGPEGSAFDGRAGSYSGVLLCDHPIDLEIDPLDTDG